MSDKIWGDDMGEISGFGGGYEAVCRAMVLAGISWVDAHQAVNPVFRGFKNVFGIAMEENEDAKALTKAMMDAPVFHDGKKIQDRAGDDCTGAMHQAAVGHVLAYKRLGWEQYRNELIEREKAEPKP